MLCLTYQCDVIVINACSVPHAGVLAKASGFPCLHMKEQGWPLNRAILPKIHDYIHALLYFNKVDQTEITSPPLQTALRKLGTLYYLNYQTKSTVRASYHIRDWILTSTFSFLKTYLVITMECRISASQLLHFHTHHHLILFSHS